MANDYKHKELTNKKEATKPPKNSNKSFTSSFKEMVVKIGESEGLKAAGEEFGLPETIVGLRTRQMGRLVKSKCFIVDDTIIDKVVEYSLQMNSWIGLLRSSDFLQR